MSENKTKTNFAECCLFIENQFPKAKRIKLVMDNLSSHTKGAFYKAFDPQTAVRMASKFEFHFTPKHGSWLNIAEIELSFLSRGVFKKRLGSALAMQMEIDARCAKKNAERQPIGWRFTTEKARDKMKSSYALAGSRSA